MRTLVAVAIALAGGVAGSAAAQPAETSVILPDWALTPRTVSGEVSVMRIRCITSPCPGPIVTVGDQVVSGTLAHDLAAFEGETVTVRGIDTKVGRIPAFAGESFAPGAKQGSDFITGEVRVVETNEDVPRIEIHTATGKVYNLNDRKAQSALAEAGSATITLFGRISPKGSRARVQDFKLTRSSFLARGRVHLMAHIMGSGTDQATMAVVQDAPTPWPDVSLQIPSGKSFSLYGEVTAGAGMGETRWISIDASDLSKLRIQSVSKPFYPRMDPVWPLPSALAPVPMPGDNTHRNALTTPQHTQALPDGDQPQGLRRD